ncbi:phosphopantetheinyl transferase PptA, putative [Nitrococcus mobilis Nb-231]|uniref:Enterobactin synthase component D n=1 Tax=Nitrococcus mobilis Nb-231 TaxID=314278 RepID=A4BLT4_9GAMM|nr:phosphopantetheinyl transferase PptA, putative [Nitrococcus mobilis Nb-231]
MWPDGIVGSISHTDSLCVSVVAAEDRFHAVGIDLEQNSRVTPELFSMLFTQRELAVLDRLALEKRFNFIPTLAFSAKEAFYKFCSPEKYFDFLDVEIEFNSHIPIFRVRLVNPKNVPVTGEIFYGRWGRFRDHVLTVICCSANATYVSKPL